MPKKPTLLIVPETGYKLNPEASHRWIELGKLQEAITNEANRRLIEIDGQLVAMMIGAGIPTNVRTTGKVKDGIVTFELATKEPEKKSGE